jgi:predicted transcriptional regulator
MGRPSLAKDQPGNSPSFVVRVTKAHLDVLNEIAGRRSVKRAVVVREAIAKFIEEEAHA